MRRAWPNDMTRLRIELTDDVTSWHSPPRQAGPEIEIEFVSTPAIILDDSVHLEDGPWPVVEFAARLTEWLSIARELESAFTYESIEAEDPLLRFYQSGSPSTWWIQSWTMDEPMGPVALDELVRASEVFVEDVRRRVDEGFGIDLRGRGLI